MKELSEVYTALCREVAAADARLVAVTKTHPVSVIQELYALGHRDFGENRAEELAEKYELLPKDINWHFIGHLQRNKVKLIARFVHLVHSVDSLRLLRELDKRAEEHRIDVLLQYHIAAEESKYGLTTETAATLLRSLREQPLEHARIVGVMGMATYTDDEAQVAGEFRELHELFRELKEGQFADDPAFSEISMGMSGDYAVALRQGSTLVRIGSLLFGERN